MLKFLHSFSGNPTRLSAGFLFPAFFVFCSPVQAFPPWNIPGHAAARCESGGTAVKVTIDFDLCQGHGVCMGECPDVFQVNDDGEVTLLQEEPDEKLAKKVQNAARFCPTGAISVES